MRNQNTCFIFKAGTLGTISVVLCPQHSDKQEDYMRDGYELSLTMKTHSGCDECDSYAQQTAAELRANTQ